MSPEGIGFFAGLGVIVLAVVAAFFAAKWSVPADADYSQSELTRTQRLIGCMPIKLLLVALIAAFFPIMIGVRDILTLIDSQQWVETQGQIVFSSLEERPTALGMSYYVKVEYSYPEPPNAIIPGDVLNQDIAIGSFPMFNELEARAELAKYAPGTPVKVYYNPDKVLVDQAVLERRVTPETYLMLGGGLLLTCIGGFAFYLFLKVLRIQRYQYEAAARNQDYQKLLFQ